VRPAPAAAVRVRGGAGAARGAAAPGALGPSRAALDAAAAVLPVVGRRPSPARAQLARAADRRASAVGRTPPGAAARSGAQVGGRHRARGAAGGGRLAEPQVPVSAAAAARTRPRRRADAGSGGS
jgi:hypothetical protein